jgi:RHS repeat-associated protein
MRILGSILLVSLLIAPSSSGPLSISPASLPGETVTLLSDGRWLIAGGEGPSGIVRTARIWDPGTRMMTVLPDGLREARAWHSATVLPDGNVLIHGGYRTDRGVLTSSELFNVKTQTFDIVASGLSPRAEHTSTLLTDGRVIVVGGISDQGTLIDKAELWDSRSAPAVQGPELLSPRHRHAASLLRDGTVLIAGGLRADGSEINDLEVYDPLIQSFRMLGSLPPDPAANFDAPRVAATSPLDGAVDVPTSVIIAARFTKPLRADSVNASTVTLSGPLGPETAAVVAAEAGLLVFVTPAEALRPDAKYSVTFAGANDAGSLLLEPTTVTFTTVKAADSGGAGTPAPSSGTERVSDTTSPSSQMNGEGVSTGSDDEIWIPGPGGRAEDWRTGRPDSPWKSLPPLTAPPGVTALSGQVLRLNGEPLANVTLAIEAATSRTDDSGRFLLTGVAPGVYALRIDGRSANVPGRTYGIFEVNVGLEAGETTILPYTVWMPKIDTAHAVTIPSYTSEEIVVTNPRIPGLEIRIPAHASIRDHEGRPVTEVSITPIPLDRPPFPLPVGVDVPLYFTVQPGGAYIATRYGKGARLIYPNSVQAAPGSHFEFWDYEPNRKGWHIYGIGSVSPNGQQVVPDPGVAVYEFTGAMVASPTYAPPIGPVPDGPTDGDPVDLATGLFVLTNTDLFLPDVLPITLNRTYRPQDSRSRAFGIGTTHPYDIFLVGNVAPWTWQDLILPDGSRIHYDRISPGVMWSDAVYEHTATPTRFYKSRIAWTGSAWRLTLNDGSYYVFPDGSGSSFPEQAAVREIGDQFGNKLTLSRNGSGYLTRVTAPNGRTIDLTYDVSNRITQVTDNIGRTVTYVYDASGRLSTVTDASGGVWEYTYDASHRMLTLKDPRQTVFLINEYDPNGRVIRQTQADTTTYQFMYTVDSATGKIGQTDVTDPRGFVRRLTFNSNGHTMTDTRAFGQPVAQMTVYERQVGTNFIVAMTDALARRTEFTYDAMGNRNSITRLAGTSNAVTTTFTYEPAFQQIATVTDPLNHTWRYIRDSLGNATVIRDPLDNETSVTYNAAGQPRTVTTQGATTELVYEAGDLVAVSDPLGNVTTAFIDNAGRLAAIKTPLGRQTRYVYDPLNRLTRIIDALGHPAEFIYDPNGNLLSVTDARNNPATYVYTNMDRVERRTDPLLHFETYSHDSNGNLATLTDRKGQPTYTTYDALDRLTQRTNADNSTTTYTWDAGNRLTQITDSIAGTITRIYDGLDRLISEATPEGSITYTYDAAGRRTSMTVTGQPTVNYGYDNANRLTSVTQGAASVGINYDGAGRRTVVTLPNGTRTEYSYDAASRLTGLTYKNGTSTLGTVTYGYDADGNRRVVGGSWARTGLPAAVGSATYNAGNQQLTFGERTLTYDLNGNLTSDGANTYAWDARDQLVSITGPLAVATFGYDGVGRRRMKTVGGSTTSFLHDGVNPVQEQYGASVATLLTGLGIDEFYARTDSTGTQSYFADALGSTVALTDAAGAVESTYTYEPFGATTVVGSTNNRYSYTGREDDGTFLKYYRGRYYSPLLQRFVSQDPAISRLDAMTRMFASGEGHPYAYVGNSPISWIDTTGLSRGKRPPGGGKPPSGPPSPNGDNPSGPKPPKRDDFKETTGQPDPIPEPPINPGTGCVKVFDNCMKWCQNRCPPRWKTLCPGACFGAYMWCVIWHPLNQ